MKFYRNRITVVLCSAGLLLIATFFIWGGWNTNEGNVIRSRIYRGELSSGAALFFKFFFYSFAFGLAFFTAWMLYFDFFRAKPLLEIKKNGILFRRSRPGLKTFDEIEKVSFENRTLWRVKFVSCHFHFENGRHPINASTLTISSKEFRENLERLLPGKIELA